MRTSLIGSLVDNVRYNSSRKQPRIRVFEIGRVFLRDNGARDGPLCVAGLRQPTLVAGAAFGPALEEQWGAASRNADFFDVKADVEALFSPACPQFEAASHPAFHPGRSARIRMGDRPLGWIGELHPKWQHKYDLSQPVVAFEVECDALQAAPLPKPEVPSKFPQVIRDMAVLVDQNIPARVLLQAILLERPAIVKDVRVFDLYHGQNLPPGRKSIAFRIVMQHTERTLTDAEADEARNSLEVLLRQRFSATLRS
jgi:phenylalanyl-tRNA synthetase beta chain